MRFLVELFDKDPIENMLGACIFKPEIVIFLCDGRDSTLFKESAIYRLLRRQGLKTRPRFYYFNATNPAAIRKVLLAVVRDYPGCVFDFTGGRDLVLLTAGALCAEMDLPGYFLDIPRSRFVDVRGCAHLAEQFSMPHFKAEDILALAGATVHGYGHFPLDEMDAAFEQDVCRVFEIVRRNPRAWGELVGWLQACVVGSSAEELEYSIPKSLRAGGQALHYEPPILEKLYGCGVLTRYEQRGKTVGLAFKSPLHKKSLLNTGIWLELYCYVTARQTGYFDDVRTSVVVDWDGVEGTPGATKNEVDVMLVKGVVPVFISCKMSLPSPLVLSEIRVLSTKFGGELSRAVVLTAGKLKEENKPLQTRAADLGILLLDGDVLQSQEKLADRLCKAVTARPHSTPKLLPKPGKEIF